MREKIDVLEHIKNQELTCLGYIPKCYQISSYNGSRINDYNYYKRDKQFILKPAVPAHQKSIEKTGHCNNNSREVKGKAAYPSDINHTGSSKHKAALLLMPESDHDTI